MVWFIISKKKYLITKNEFIVSKSFEALEKSIEIKKDSHQNIKRYINQGYLPGVYPNDGIEYKKYYLDLVKKHNFSPVGLYPNIKTLLCDEGYGYIKYKADHLGLRNKQKEWENYPYDTIIIGDSYMHGMCVDTQYEVAEILRSNGRQVISFGMGDNQPVQYYYIINQFSKPLAPKNLVVVFYSGNDFGDSDKFEYIKSISKKQNFIFSEHHNYHILSNDGKKFYEEFNNHYKNEIKEFLKEESVEKEINVDIKKIFLLRKIRRILEYKYGIAIKKKKVCYKTKCIHGEYTSGLFNNSEEVIQTLVKNCNPKNNCNPIIALLPNSSHWKPGETFFLVRDAFSALVKNYQLEFSYLKYFDASKVINANDLRNYAPSGGHLSIKGYNDFAIGLQKHLK